MENMIFVDSDFIELKNIFLLFVIFLQQTSKGG